MARDETVAGAAVRLASVLRDSYLPLQGPPGTGKTYTAAEQILALVAQGRTVGITGPSHAVIHHLMTGCACMQAGEALHPELARGQTGTTRTYAWPAASRRS